MNKPKMLFVTDLYYPAKGRPYYSEDILLTSELVDSFDLVLCNPRQTEQFEKMVDLIVFRNAGAVLKYKDIYEKFVERVKKNNLKTYNSFTGAGDMRGKDYLLQMTKQGLAVIPTVGLREELDFLPKAPKYIIKPKNGADSIGLEIVDAYSLRSRKLDGYLIQPFIDFEYEVSFYFVDSIFEYSLYAPNKNERWDLKTYSVTEDDLSFARSFINWNSLKHGIQRVDACRTRDGKLLLVELEDLNPYLSLEILDERVREKFISDFKTALFKVINSQ